MLTRWLAPLLVLTSALGAAAQDALKPGFAPPKVAPAAGDGQPANPQSAPPPPVPELDLLSDLKEEPPRKKQNLEPPPNAKSKNFFGPGAEPYMLTLHEAIRLALSNDLEARVEEAGVSLEKARVRNAYGVYDPVFSFSLLRSQTRTPDNRQNITSADSVAQLSQIQAQIDAINRNTDANQAFTRAILNALGRPVPDFNTTPLSADFSSNQRVIFEQESDRGQVALQLRSPLGTVLQASAGFTHFESTFEGDTRKLSPNYLFNSSLEFRQPLLRDFGLSVNLADLHIAQKNMKAQEYRWRLTTEKTLQRVASDYFDMVFGLNDLTNKGDAIMAGLKLVAFSARRKDLGFLSEYEVQQARAQLALDQALLQSSKGNFLRFQYSMKRQILPGYDMADRRVLLPMAMPALKVPKISRGELLSLAYENRMDYKAALLAAEAQQVRIEYARNQLYPKVDLVATYGWNGLDSSYPSSLGQATEGQADSWSVGVQGQIALANIQARAQLMAAKTGKEQAILQISIAEREVGLSVDQAIDLIRTNEELLKEARFATQMAAEAVRIGVRLMEEGLKSNFEIIQQQRFLYDARTRELAAVADLNKSITELWLATGTVLEKLNVELGPPRPATGKPVAQPAQLGTPPRAVPVNNNRRADKGR